MFEVIAAVCALEGGACRDMLLPGHEAATRAACEDGLAGLAAPALPGLAAAGAPRCREAGPGLVMEEVAPGIFVHAGAVAEPGPGNGGDASNLGFVIGQDSVAVIDSGSSRAIGEDLWRAIRARSPLPVRYAILTHMHPDHVFGASVLAEAGAEVIGRDGLGRALADRAESYLARFGEEIGPGFLGTQIPVVAREIAGPEEIDLGGRRLRLVPWPEAHSPTDLTVAEDGAGLLFAGDLVFDRHAPALDGSLRGWQTALRALAAEPFSGVVPGHGAARLPWPEGAAPVQRYLARLAEDTRAALDAGMRMGDAIETVAASEAGNWQLFGLFNPRNATVAYAELEWE
ncbi:quinoprotein relay system zinc metallohydrolase 2 [Poseidonocella sp. HB161398]|uniref:quinoprotein relay system zinc metallohydrolase 2 n=1 Tax=Poseidonocella sp. HB161398 TaxID=2320855 RepID=UPI001108B844|nr:quinoprotein relay system zinc metallohydrolase 2 [Poseidonocella sp. HB161398]